MTHVLAFDVSTEHVAIGIARIEGAGYSTVASVDFNAPRAALGRLLPAVHELLDGAGLAPSDISAVAVGRGPGSFTGVRIAAATAKGLAHGLGAPLAGLGTLDAVAWRFKDADGIVGIVGDAMRGEVYPCLFRCGGGSCERLDEYSVAKPVVAAEAWAERIAEPIVLAGNGLAKYAGIFQDALGELCTLADESLWTPTGVSVLDAAFAGTDAPSLAGVLADAATGQPGLLLPVYTRLSDAEEDEAKRVGAVPATGVAGPGTGGCV